MEYSESVDPPFTARYTSPAQVEMRAKGIPPEKKPLSCTLGTGSSAHK